MPDDEPKAPYDPRVPPELRPVMELAKIAKEMQQTGTPSRVPHLSINIELVSVSELVEIAALLKKLRTLP